MFIIYACPEFCKKRKVLLNHEIERDLATFHMIYCLFRCHAASGLSFWYDIIWTGRESSYRGRFWNRHNSCGASSWSGMSRVRLIQYLHMLTVIIQEQVKYPYVNRNGILKVTCH
jgi:hypothetical protein